MDVEFARMRERLETMNLILDDIQVRFFLNKLVCNTGCPNKFGIGSNMFASETSIVYKKSLYFAPKNCFLSLFGEMLEMNMEFKATYLQFPTIY